jgi:hypothetical protein
MEKEMSFKKNFGMNFKFYIAAACLASSFFLPVSGAQAAVETAGGCGGRQVALTLNSPVPDRIFKEGSDITFAGRIWQPGSAVNFGRCAKIAFFAGPDRDAAYADCCQRNRKSCGETLCPDNKKCAPAPSCQGGENILYASNVETFQTIGDQGIVKLGEIAAPAAAKTVNSGDYEIEFNQTYKLPETLVLSGKVRFYIQYGGIGMDSAGLQAWQWLIAYQPGIIESASVVETSDQNIPRVSAGNVVATDYCTSSAGPAAILYWSWHDPLGSKQSAYQVQIGPDPDFIDGVSDSGKIFSETVSYATPIGKLLYDKRYYWRVRAWRGETASAWSPGASFMTPLHPYPIVRFDWTPKIPFISEKVAFSDKSVINGNSGKASWSWTFDDGMPDRSQAQNPTLVFGKKGVKKIFLTVTDSDGYSCSSSRLLQVDPPFPE